MAKRGMALTTLAHVRRFAAKVANMIYRGDMEESRGRVLIYAASILKDIIKESDLEARITALEAQLKGDQKR